MKKILIAIACFISINAAAQGVKINAYTNYVFDDQVDSYYDNESYFDGKIKGGFQWGVGLQYNFKEFYGLELTYYNQSTTANANYQVPGTVAVKNGNFDVNLNWIMLNGVRELRKPGSKFEAFGGMGLGVALINTENRQNGNTESSTNFAWQLRGGGNIWVSEKIAIKLNAQLQSAVQSVGGGFYIGTGGTGAGVSSYSSLLQFGLGGGLAFKLGQGSTSGAGTSQAAPQKF
jgi:Outer membrane protein beta-barrel domain